MFGGPGAFPFVYTIGNSLKGLPELLIVGLCDDHGILNAASDVMRARGRGFDNEERVSVGGKFPFVAIDAAEVVKELYTRQVERFVGRADYAVQQVVFCDLRGRFPWEPGCAKPYCEVPVHRRLNS